MAKLITFAVAGSGKTTRLVNSLDPTKRSIILTYTTTNVENIRKKVADRFGLIPENVLITPYFTFLYSFCFRPFLADKFAVEGINYKHIDRFDRPKTSIDHYLDYGRRIWSARIFKAIVEFGLKDQLVSRINKYFDCAFIDEVQDFASYDFDFLSLLATTRLDVELVGDFYQHTYDTSRDLKYRNTLFDDFSVYKELLVVFGYMEHPSQLTRSYRCSRTLCEYVSENLGIAIASHGDETTRICFVEDEEQCRQLLNSPTVVKLFFSKHFEYGLVSRNWGECKGEDDYTDVCVVLNKTSLGLYAKGALSSSAQTTRNKLYVALTRARNDVFLVSEELVKKLVLGDWSAKG